MKVFVTGGTGFVGSNVVQKLLENGHDVVLLGRNSKSLDAIPNLTDKVTPVYGSIQDKATLSKAMAGCNVVINLVGIIKEGGENTFEKVHYDGAVNVIDTAKSSGISRFIHMSAEGTRKDAPSRYHLTKFKAEEYLKNSGLNYTIFRPAMMFGPDDKNFNVLADMIKKAPIVPVIGSGNYSWQPVSVKNIAELFVLSINNNKSVGKIYEVKGPQVFTFNQILDLLMRILDLKRPKVHIPVGLMRLIVSLFEGILPLPITADQLKMLLDDFKQPESNFLNDFPINLIPLEEGLREYIGRR